MNILVVIIQQIKSNFDFLSMKGYMWQPFKVYNEDDKQHIFATLTTKNSELNRELSFSIYPNTSIDIEIYVTDCVLDQSMDFKHYIEFKQGLKLKYSPSFSIDGRDIIGSVDRLSEQIKSLIESDLKDVIENKKWITFPTYDPRDDY